MRRTWIVITLIIICASVIPTNTYAQMNDVSARNAILMEEHSGRVLYGKLEHKSEKIASITKIMTALLAAESGKMKEAVPISNEAVRVEGSAIYLKPGQKVPLEDLVYGLMLRSGNDAAQAIAENVGGSIEGFVYLMNEKAKEIGMKDTHFSNPHGLDGDGTHYSSAYDMALLTRYAIGNEIFRKIFGTKTYQSKAWDYPWKNKHKLVTSYYEYATGGKTGFTKKAGRTLVTTASKDGLDLIVVTLNASSDWDDHMYLFDQGFKQYKLTKVLQKGALSGVQEKKYANHIYTKYDLSVPLTNEEKDQVTLKIELDKGAKLVEGEKVGRTLAYVDEKEVGERNLFYSKRKLIATTGVYWNDVQEIFSHMLGVGTDG
ncbi:D-alanyl-D-alanine carboxypeptidase family protein [Bacillus sp. DX1.1]|uniref:D-alanyl-D-alanine carboxypeptidase family protein n=1 Tax=unclassified Bacillus (in: firmicutes) TaxID=185979 RepID=UPI002570228D|nr:MULTISPECIES: D-alanyl-D-alanine carboxypeptidase family protein [unclassified Bacillus (in: firmicutes)]MDM5154094.1 D-alanyl-D-alanine carboxypeptidase family protein [Bacillus sp. DX1.1]WJE83021.1 D-alanyl-D-alanine carboxypeptidase family protein [Bacillus sp. DX3.1]